MNHATPQDDKDDPLMKRADMLVQAAKVASGPALASAKAKYGFLSAYTSKPEDDAWWEIVFTIAAVYIAATRLRNLEIGAARETKLMERVTERLLELNPNALAAFEDCKAFFGANFDAMTARGHEVRFTASDSIGLWVVWNMLDRAPETEGEAGFVRGVGVAITHGFFSWWD